MVIFLKISRLLNLFLSASTYFLFMFLCECECHKYEQYICLSCVCTCLCVCGREEDKREWANEREHADTCVYAEPSKEHEVSSHHSLPYALETKSLKYMEYGWHQQTQRPFSFSPFQHWSYGPNTLSHNKHSMWVLTANSEPRACAVKASISWASVHSVV